MKKVLLALGITGATLAPLATVIACGSSGTDSYYGVTLDNVKSDYEAEVALLNKDLSDKTITIGVRATTSSVMNAIADKFNELSGTKGKVKIKSVEIPDYATMSASDSLPEVFLSDTENDTKMMSGGRWAAMFDLDHMLSGDTYNIFDNQETDLGKESIIAGHLKTTTNTHGVSVAMPSGYTAKTLITNYSMVNPENIIYSFAMAKEGENKDKLVEISTGMELYEFLTLDQAERMALPNIDGYGKATPENMQKYISEAGNKEAISSTNETNVDTGWSNYGPGNTIQRIASLGFSAMHEDAVRNGSFTTVIKELAMDPMIYSAFEEGALANASGAISDDTVQDVIKKGDVDADLKQYLWDNFGAYMGTNSGKITNSAFASNDSDLSQAGEVEPVYRKQAMFNWNAKWAANSINSGWDNNTQPGAGLPGVWRNPLADYESGKAFSSGEALLLSVPYGSTSGDSFAISANASAEERLIGKRFLKFISSTHADSNVNFTADEIDYTLSAGEAVANNFVSSLLNVSAAQSEKLGVWNVSEPFAEEVRDFKSGEAFGNFGVNEKGVTSDEYNGIGGQFWSYYEGDSWTRFASLTILVPEMQIFKPGSTETGYSKKMFDDALDRASVTFWEETALT